MKKASPKLWRGFLTLRKKDDLRKAGLFPYDLKDDPPPSRPVVEVEEDNLLPGAKEQKAVLEGDGDGGAEERRPDVGEAVPVPPPGVMGVGDVLGGYPTKSLPEVLQGTVFVLYGCRPPQSSPGQRR